KDQTPLYLKIKALIAAQPDTCVRWAEVLCRAEAKSLTMRLVPAALSVAGHEQAQAALGATLETPAKASAVAKRLIPLLAKEPVPTQQAENALLELALPAPEPVIAGMAELGLGTMARHLQNSSPERSARIVADAVAKLDCATSEARRQQQLM